MSLFDKLLEYSDSDVTPMHMPGHKRHAVDDTLPYAIDITEIEGFDNLHNRHRILKELADRCAALRGADCAFPLIGGSTAGILAAVYAMTKPGDTVIIARGCHKAVYHACEICNLNVKYIFPETDKSGFFLSVTPESVEAALNKNPGTSLVVITSPTYEGVISDTKSIGDVVHRYGAKLFVDGAHGAHLGYCDGFAPDSLSQGVDVCVESLHKTLPALTQTAVLFVKDKSFYSDLENALDIFETSS
ncbi:MAG: aminotransferase class V-fold PLP-dependent enzyme, partial [Clostridia bacterium]|nr:aminotransferase class V-fold PLP-dependent enzyme [Clostridia bacterium]